MLLDTVFPSLINHNVNISSTFIFYSLLVPTFILLYIYWKLSRRHLLNLAEKIPGPKGYPLIGNALDYVGSNTDITYLLNNVHTKIRIVFECPKRVSKCISFLDIFYNTYKYSFIYKTVCRVWIGPKLLTFLMDPRDVELILSSQTYINKGSDYSFFKPWLGDGLLISTGDKWRRHRKLIAPTFHLNVLKSFIDLFNANSRGVVNKLKIEVGKTFDCHDYMSEATVEMLLETAMGVSKSTQDKSCYEYAMAVMKMCDILHLRHTKVWLRPNWIFSLTKYSQTQTKLLEIIHGLTRKVIKKKKSDIQKGIHVSSADVPQDARTAECDVKEKTVVEGLSFGQSSGLKDDLDVDDNDIGEKKRGAFLDLMLEAAQNGAMISDEEIKEQVDTIMFEGHDTTAAASSFFLSLMGIHQDIQDKVIRELDEIFGDSDRPVTFADTLEMKYLERCLMETLRMYPPVPVIARELQEDVKLASSDLVIPAGTTVVIGTFKIHRRDDIYPNPDVFNPDNFLPEKTTNRHYYSFIPFSAGPRSCVGRKYAMLKLKILLSTILRSYRIYSDLEEADFNLQADIILKRAEGFPIQIKPRRLITT
ncbi:cytochrome p450 family 4 [Holotrichia oblita]|uniref:Cytochrome p450 family 4 n=1 Tax=Holotrichia oblita TaxID=644536 RepID=A0ACB9T6Z3_HOLOL|nr:cytochrome p450 family 4 [Holotrichia oblita]